MAKQQVASEVKPPNRAANNRFSLAQAWCPRCDLDVKVEKFIVNADEGFVLMTFACPACTDVVQVVMRGESAANGSPRNRQYQRL